MKGLVAFSFGLSKDSDPGPCNMRLAITIERILREEEGQVLTVSQVEIATALIHAPNLIVRAHRIPGRYLDSEEVMAQAAAYFRKNGITEVIIVAQPFLHMRKCVSLVRKDGFVAIRRPMDWIGFDRKSAQWWTRDRFRLIIYAILQKLLGYRGESHAS
jgi:hypothetical protein